MPTMVVAFFCLSCTYSVPQADDSSPYTDKQVATVEALPVVAFSAMSFSRHELADPSHLEKIIATGNLGGKIAGDDFYGVTGWFEYDFTIVQKGWYELLVETTAPFRDTQFGAKHDYIIDGTVFLDGSGYAYASGQANFKAGNLWLTPGKHTLRIQNYYWTGFNPLTGFTFKRSDSRLSNRLRMAFAGQAFFGGVFVRRGEPLALSLYTDGKYLPRQLRVGVFNAKTQRLLQTIPVVATSLVEPEMIQLDVSTASLGEGPFFLRALSYDKPIDERDVRRLDFVVIDAANADKTTLAGNDDVNKILIDNGTIDCGDPARPPDYSDQSPKSGVGQKHFRYENDTRGSYIESSANGFRENLGSPKNTNWFAYRLPEVKSDNTYALEIDYPDDRWRSFVFGIRESLPMDLTLATGIDGGGEYTLSHAKQTATMLYWPRTDDTPRLFFANAIDGSSAPCVATRLYKLDSALPALRISPNGKRHFAYWFEEHDRWATVFGAKGKSLDEYRKSAERWAKAARFFGVDVLHVTATIYNGTLYPSRQFNRAVTSGYHSDLLHLLLLVAEKYDIKVIIGLHPQALELHNVTVRHRAGENLLYDRDGNTYKTVPTGPVRGTGGVQPTFNPLHKDNQQWLVGMIGEIADRYYKYTALAGIELRTMAWANSSLNNLVNLDWGYGDYTMSRLKTDTGIDLRQESFKTRYETLTSPVYRERWIRWRCEKIGALYGELIERIRQNRNDLTLFTVFNGGFGFPLDPSESGLCPDVLRTLDGISVIDADLGYGRINITGDYWKSRIGNLEHYERMFDPVRLRKFTGVGKRSYSPAFMMSAWYMEDGGTAVPPSDLGLPVNTGHPWISAQMHAAGRQDLERYAYAVAESDAKLLANGGNGYYLDFPHVREFMAEFRSLPADDFTPVPGADDPIAARFLQRDNDMLFYLVNREPYAIKVDVDFVKPMSVFRITDDSLVTGPRRRLTLTLEPFALRAFRTDKASSGITVSSDIPTDKQFALTAKIQWLQALYIEQSTNQSANVLSDSDQRFLNDLLQRLNAARATKHMWQSRLLLNQSRLYQIYKNVNRFPPFVDMPLSN